MNRHLVERIKYSPISRVATLPLRAQATFPYLARNGARALTWLLRAREWANANYDYEPIGVTSMAAAIGIATSIDPRMIRSFADELRSDAAFAERYRQRVTSTKLRYITEPDLRFGKFLYLYMLVRATRPRIVFEAGTEKGLGALAICRALAQNAALGAPGKLVTVDIAADRGGFLEGDEGGLATRLTGDSVAAIDAMDSKIDFFLHETITDPDHCRAQFAALERRLAPGAVIHSAWLIEEFVEFCERNNLAYLEVVERPRDHWDAGRHFGLAWARRRHQDGTMSTT